MAMKIFILLPMISLLFLSGCQRTYKLKPISLSHQSNSPDIKSPNGPADWIFHIQEDDVFHFGVLEIAYNYPSFDEQNTLILSGRLTSSDDNEPKNEISSQDLFSQKIKQEKIARGVVQYKIEMNFSGKELL